MTLTLTQTLTLTLSRGTPLFPEGNIMQEHKILNRLQALDFTEAGVASYTRVVPIPQAGNERLDSTLSSITAQHSVGKWSAKSGSNPPLTVTVTLFS